MSCPLVFKREGTKTEMIFHDPCVLTFSYNYLNSLKKATTIEPS